jgi:hypothetical protein
MFGRQVDNYSKSGSIRSTKYFKGKHLKGEFSLLHFGSLGRKNSTKKYVSLPVTRPHLSEVMRIRDGQVRPGLGRAQQVRNEVFGFVGAVAVVLLEGLALALHQHPQQRPGALERAPEVLVVVDGQQVAVPRVRVADEEGLRAQRVQLLELRPEGLVRDVRLAPLHREASELGVKLALDLDGVAVRLHAVFVVLRHLISAGNDRKKKRSTAD